jgi:RHS repeat-associated protein
VSQANGTHYAAPDGSGNVVALFGTSGTETARYEYGPFGELLRMSGTAIAAENPWRFSSKRQDPTTDWVHYEFRVYDPSSGRWLSRDPIGEAGGENLYGFVGNDPVNRVDLLGLQETGGGVVALQLMPPPVLPRQWPSGSTPCSASVPRISVPLPQCNPIADVIWGKPVQAPQPCPPRHFIGAPTPGPKIPVPRGLTSAEAYRYNSFLMAFGSSGLCDSPIGFRLAQINMQLINHAAAIPSQAQVDGVLRFGGAVLDRIGRCGGNLPRFPCTGPSPCVLEGSFVAKTTVYRVEGLPNTRVVLGEGGRVIVQGDQMLFLNFGDTARAEQFLATRLEQGMAGVQMKSFEVPRSFYDDLCSSAVPERMAKQFPGRPLIVDPTKAADQFGLRAEQIEALRDVIIQGSGRVH